MSGLKRGHALAGYLEEEKSKRLIVTGEVTLEELEGRVLAAGVRHHVLLAQGD